ncbi:MAG: phospho-N-acetylmuramoyl-pentapeptide-transferase [Candidatus Omnitrophica bacterium]|nr:phospho-N-acetylmuramoyl-pentapeptide-transferase [Candidatus Omnitrophota bacterium]
MREAGIVLAISAMSCLLIAPAAIRALVARGWIQPVRYQDCPPLMPIQHTKQGVPTMGGIVVLGVAIMVAVIWGGLATCEGWVLLGTMGSLGLMGWVDDWLKLRRPNAKGLLLMTKLLIALSIGAGVQIVLNVSTPTSRDVLIPWAHRAVDVGWLNLPLAMAVIAGSAHAVNLTDGMDGLAAGCLVVAFGLFGVWLVLRQPSDHVLAIWCASLTGACLGFLWFNTYPASVFLGDVGSLGLGAALGTIAWLSHASLVLLIIGGVFVVEAVSVILQVASFRFCNQRRIFRVAPLHHHFQLGGIPEAKLVVRFWIVGALLAVLGWSALSQS